jgi:hypothetical protein
MKSLWTVVLTLLAMGQAVSPSLAQRPTEPSAPVQVVPPAAPAAPEAAVLFPIVDSGKWGLIDVTGKVVIEPRYDQLASYAFEDPFYNRLPSAVAAREMLFEARPTSRGLLPYCLKRRCGVLGPTGTEVIPARYDGAGGWFAGGLLRVKKNGRWGFINEAGAEVIPAAYEWLWDFAGGVALAKIDETHWTLLDPEGRRLLDPPWPKNPDTSFVSQQPVSRAYAGGRWGLVDRYGRWVVAPTFESLGRFIDDGLINAQLGGKWGFIDTSGKWVIEPRFDVARGFGCTGFAEDMALVEIGGQSGLINRKGEVLFLTPNELRCNGGPLLTVITPQVPGMDVWSRRYGLIDASGRVVVEPQFHSILGYSEGLYLALLHGKPSYLDAEGRTVISGVGGGPFREGLATHRGPSTLLGYIDRTGRVIIEPAYERATDFDGGLAKVVDGDRVSYLDRTGRVVYSMRFQQSWRQ